MRIKTISKSYNYEVYDATFILNSVHISLESEIVSPFWGASIGALPTRGFLLAALMNE